MIVTSTKLVTVLWSKSVLLKENIIKNISGNIINISEKLPQI
jgi:hypothetical protein